MSKVASTLVGALALVALAACSDQQLVVRNPNSPDEERALASPTDVENLVGSQFRNIHTNTDGDILNLTAQLLCLGMENWSGLANGDMGKTAAIPRVGIDNNRGNTTYTEKYNPYLGIYRAARSVALGLNKLNAPGFTFLPTSAAEKARDQAFGYFTLGVAMGDIALVWDSGAVVSPNDDVSQAAPPFVAHDVLMQAAIADLDTAIQYASVSASGGNGFPIPSTWINGQSGLTGGASGTFVRLVKSWRARFRAGVARTPAERAAVDWTQVIADAQDGITADFNILMTRGSPTWQYWPVQMSQFQDWHQMWQFVLGMADTSGVYTQYLANEANFSPFLVVTPDKRFPTGDHRAKLNAADTIAGPTGPQNLSSGCAGSACTQPDSTLPYPYFRNRLSGSDAPGAPWGFSMYDFYRFQAYYNASREGNIPTITLAEMNALIAEGYIRQGNVTAALPYINATRVPAGLPALTMADTVTRVPGTTDGCVPKIPAAPNFTSAICGNVWEAMKWEKRMETAYTHWGAWWIDGRGWGDLPKNTVLEFPTPYQELDTRLLPIYSTVQIAGPSTYGLGGP
jgi:hypothetical protein